MTDPFGGQTIFTYDSTGIYLLSVQNSNGTVESYTYNTASGPAFQALAAVTHANGVSRSFSYDSFGRLAGTHNNASADASRSLTGQEARSIRPTQAAT